MAEYALLIKASVPAASITSASKKARDLEAALAKQGWQTPEVHVKGKAA